MKNKHKEEYESVVKIFNVKNNFNGKILKIERIQNLDLYENYFYARKRILNKYDHKSLNLSENHPDRKYSILILYSWFEI